MALCLILTEFGEEKIFTTADTEKRGRLREGEIAVFGLLIFFEQKFAETTKGECVDDNGCVRRSLNYHNHSPLCFLCGLLFTNDLEPRPVFLSAFLLGVLGGESS